MTKSMPITVLLADDHRIVRDGIRLLLEGTGSVRVVTEADNGRDAVTLAIAHLPDIAILDIAMPELNGIDATDQIKAAAPDVLVIILSMFGSLEHVAQAFRAGASGFLVKEAAGRELVEAVLAVHSGRTFVSNIINRADLELYSRRAGLRVGDGPFTVLSRREREVLQLVAEGCTSLSIAEKLGLSPKTVDTYRCRLMAKLGVANVPDLVRLAIRHGLTTG